MGDAKSNVLSIAYEVDGGIRAKSISESKITDILAKSRLEMADVSVDVVKENMLKTLSGVMEVFENKELEDKKFYVDEIEVALSVGCEGSVSILSAVSGQAEMQSSILVRLKRRAD